MGVGNTDYPCAVKRKHNRISTLDVDLEWKRMDKWQ
jgi:hypothetical protein